MRKKLFQVIFKCEIVCLRVFYQYLFIYVLNCTQCCIFSCFRCCTVDQHRSGVTRQEDWRPMRSTVLQLLCATDRAARTVHQRQAGLCPPVSTIPIIYIQCTLQVAFDVMFLNCWISHSHLCRLPIGLKFSFSNAISSLIQTIRTNPNCSTFWKFTVYNGVHTQCVGTQHPITCERSDICCR